MAIPFHYNTQFAYAELLAVVDVQTIMNKLYDMTITDRSSPDKWTCSSGAKGSSPITLKSPDRVDGAFYTLALTRASATRLVIVMTDCNGMLVNNQTNNNLDINAAGNNVQLFTGPFHLCINSARATQECFYCGIADQTPELLATPRPIFFCTAGPRNTSGTLTNNSWGHLFCMTNLQTAYTLGGQGYYVRSPFIGSLTSPEKLVSLSGALITPPIELTFMGTQYTAGWWAGRICQAVLVDSGQSLGTEVNVPLDGATTGVFKICGTAAYGNLVVAFRKGTL